MYPPEQTKMEVRNMASLAFKLVIQPLINSLKPVGPIEDTVVSPDWFRWVDKLNPQSKRSFQDVYYAMKAMLPEELQSDLAFQMGFWAPEVAWVNLNDWVHENIPISSSSEDSVHIYALLCDMSVDDMEAKMIRDGY